MATRAAPASDFDVVLNEVHHHPFGTGEPKLEHVELYNRGLSPVDLSGWSFAEGIDFTFAAGTFLDPGAYLAVSADAASLRALHPGAPIIGDFGGHLDNSGEVIHLVNAGGQSISRVHFRSAGAWPSRADGKGPSLELLVSEGDIDRPQVWAPSLRFGGTPGAPNTRGREEFPYNGKEKASLVRLNEVKPGTGGADRGYVEVWNGGTAPADIGGYRILSSFDQAATIPPGSNVPAGGYLVITASTLSFSPGPEPATYALLASDGATIVDALETPAVAAGFSAGRFPDGASDGFVMQPSAGAANAFSVEERVVINEVFFSPRFEAPSAGCSADCADRHQWIELFNRSGSAVDLSGWSLSKAVDFTFAPGTQIAAGSFLVVAASQAVFSKDHPGVAAAPGEWTGKLGQHEDNILLHDALQNVVDRVHYGNGDPFNDADGDGRDDGTVTSSDWPTGVDRSGRSIELVNHFLENAAGRSWRLGPVGGSPGARNTTFLDDPPPVILDVKHFPHEPDSKTPVTVTCRAHAVDSIAAVELAWKIDGQANVTRVAMRDDGASGDGAAGDSVYGAVIPPQANRSIIAFQITATSASSKADTYPPRPSVGARIPFYLYEVDDSPPLANGSVSYRVIMTRADLDALKTRPVTSDVRLNCTFIGDGEVHQMAAIRYRGENSRSQERKAYRIEFPPEDPFEGIVNLNLNASYSIGSLLSSSVRDFLAADLFRRAGMAGPQEWPVNLYFQRGVGGDLAGHPDIDPFYIRKEHCNGDFLSRFFGGNGGGNLYRPIDPSGAGSGDLSYLGEDPSKYVPFYEKRSNSDENSYTDVIELTRAFDRNQTSDADFENEMRRLIDVNEWARFFAIQDLITNIDGAIQTNNGEDYFLYRVSDDAKRLDAGLWLILPWDLEETFNDPQAGLFLTEVAAARRFLRHSAFAPLYLASLKDLIARAASKSEMRPRYQYAFDIYPASSAPGVAAVFDNYIARRLPFVRDQIVSRIEVAVESSPTQGNKIISEGDVWSYFKGTQEPSGGTLDWASTDFNDTSWPKGPSGFGYGDNDDATVFNDMRRAGANSGFYCVYVRKELDITDPASLSGLSLVVDYDDAFVAYLNGTEIVRSAGLAGAGPADAPIAFNHEIGNSFNHEASRGNNSPNPIETFPIGAWRSLLFAGKNVLALQGFNSTLDSSDLSLIPELAASVGGGSSGGGWGSELFVSGPTARLQGVADATVTGSLKLNGVLATITSRPPSGAPYGLVWRASVPVVPGTQSIRIDALSGPDGSGVITDTLYVTVHRIDKGFASGDGQISGSVTWTEAEGPYLVTTGLRVPPGASLTIEPGAQVLVASGASITVEGVLDASGTADSPIGFHPFAMSGAMSGRWGGINLARTGTGDADPVQRLRFVDFELGSSPSGANGCIAVRASKLLVEGCRFERLSSNAIDARDSRLEVKDSTFEDIHGGVVAQTSVVTVTGSRFSGVSGDSDAVHLNGDAGERSHIEDCVIERSEGDGIELNAATADILRNTIRFIANRGCIVGVAGSLGPSTVEGNVIHNAVTGLELKGGGEVAGGSHDTIVYCGAGLRLSGDDQGLVGGQASFDSLILWRNAEDIVTDAQFQLSLTWSDVATSGPWPGEGNIGADPRLRDPHAEDFALAIGSPCAGTGKGATDMGSTGASAPGVVFLRGDVTGDGKVNLTDGITILGHLFRGTGPLACEDAGDTDDNGAVNLSDVIGLLNFLYRGGPTIAPPYPEAGRDPTEDALECR